MKTVYLICGVPGSGKTWVCKQLTDQFKYIPHDEHYKNQAEVLIKAAKESDKDVITEVPLFISKLIKELDEAGVKTKAYFVIEHPAVVKERYETREGKPIPKQHLSRIETLWKRSREYGVFTGNSEKVLSKLKELSTK